MVIHSKTYVVVIEDNLIDAKAICDSIENETFTIPSSTVESEIPTVVHKEIERDWFGQGIDSKDIQIMILADYKYKLNARTILAYGNYISFIIVNLTR